MEIIPYILIISLNGYVENKIFVDPIYLLLKENICLTIIISDVLLETLSVPSVSGNSLHNHQVNIIRVKEASTILKRLSYEKCVKYLSHWWVEMDDDLNLFTTYFSHKMLLDAFAEINQNLLKIYIIHILLNFMRKLSCKQIQVNSSFISTHQCDRYLTQRSLLFQSEFQAIWFAIRKKHKFAKSFYKTISWTQIKFKYNSKNSYVSFFSIIS